MNKKCFQPAVIIFVLGWFGFSCSQNEEVGLEIVDNPLELWVIDTFSVNASTFLYDSLPSSASETLLAGSYHDAVLGDVKTKSFFQVGLSGEMDTENTLFDSLFLVLKYTGYQYGNLESTSSLQVHRVLENLDDGESDRYYQFSSIAYEPEPLASFSLKKEPEEGDSIAIKLPESLGEELFEKIKDEADTLSAQSDFLEYFKGLVLVSESKEGKVVAFALGDAALHMHYHKISDTDEPDTYVFPVVNSSLQFNQFQANRSNTILTNLEPMVDLSAEDTDGNTFIQPGVGLVTRIRFPSIREFKSLGNNYLINLAKLRINVEAGTYNEHSLPEELVLYQFDKYTPWGGVLYENFLEEQAQVASLQLDLEAHQNTYYEFTITDYLDSLMSLPDNLGNGLLLGLPFPEEVTTLDRVIVGPNQGQNQSIQLLLYVTIIHN
ncbi:DUF4270 family protein [Rapidithrix thailandica]|uniref:DUF4270 family protein n=1 Tax=Rapidithrix thailandica TaxID=413964 RepID=A0AAW9S931_9BACT